MGAASKLQSRFGTTNAELRQAGFSGYAIYRRTFGFSGMYSHALRSADRSLPFAYWPIRCAEHLVSADHSYDASHGSLYSETTRIRHSLCGQVAPWINLGESSQGFTRGRSSLLKWSEPIGVRLLLRLYSRSEYQLRFGTRSSDRRCCQKREPTFTAAQGRRLD